MSRKGNCYDNSVMEHFFGLLKQEIYYGNVYYSYDELKVTIEKYIKYYNEQRIKEKPETVSLIKSNFKGSPQYNVGKVHFYWKIFRYE